MTTLRILTDVASMCQELWYHCGTSIHSFFLTGRQIRRFRDELLLTRIACLSVVLPHDPLMPVPSIGRGSARFGAQTVSSVTDDTTA